MKTQAGCLQTAPVFVSFGLLMPRNRIEWEELEAKTLAPYAQKNADSRGREFDEPKHEFRTDFQRDRDRVIHSRAFRRLEYKTQVFLNGTGDHLRTRLTHTMEVASIARNLARALRVNEDLAEAIALAHDLGHSPCGHSGEETLNELMKERGGFEHNGQSLRVVTILEQKYPQFDGLNLTWETREGLAKHCTHYDRPEENPEFADFKSSSLEAQIANLADEIAYYSHDLDDGLECELIREEQLKDIEIWQTTYEEVARQHPNLEKERLRGCVIRNLIDAQNRDVIETTEKNIRESGVKSADDVRHCPKLLVSYSKSRAKMNAQLRKFLYDNLYFNPIVHEPHVRACAMIRELFRAYVANPALMSESAQKRIEKHGIYRTVCDHIAGMTDRYVLQEYRRLQNRRG
jgi:dGTPase